MLLIRDWSLDPELVGLEGGLKYLEQESLLSRSFGNIQQAFEKTNCFLLQHPGKTVSGSGKASTISIKG